MGFDAVIMQLSRCASSLARIDKRLSAYLDRVECDIAVNDAPPKFPGNTVCGFCFQEQANLIECEHARLCQGCAPCDQCEP